MVKKAPKRSRAQLNLQVKAEENRTLVETHLCDIDSVYEKYADEPTRQALGDEWLRGFAAGKGVKLLDVLQLIDNTIDIELDRGETLGLKRNKGTIH